MNVCARLDVAQLLLGINLFFLLPSPARRVTVSIKSQPFPCYLSCSKCYPFSLMRLCLRTKCDIWDAVMFPARAHTLNAVYFAELMAAALNQHVGGWRAACTPKIHLISFQKLHCSLAEATPSKSVKNTNFFTGLILCSTSNTTDLFWMFAIEELNPTSLCKFHWIKVSDQLR